MSRWTDTQSLQQGREVVGMGFCFQVKGLQAASWRRWQLYTEPGDELEAASSPTKRTSRTIVGEKEEELEALPEGTLARYVQ